MSARTYALDADMIDRLMPALGRLPVSHDLLALLDTIEAQRPKPRIPWVPGTKVRRLRLIGATAYMLTDDARHSMAVIVDSTDRKSLGTIQYLGYVNGAGLDPEQWEVVE